MRLSDAVSIRKGKKPEAIVAEAAPGYRRLIQIDDLRPGAIQKFCPPTRDEVLADSRDVIIAWDGANAATSGFGLTGVIGSTLAILRPQRDDVFTPYLGHFVLAQQQYLRERCKGATVPHIDGRVLEALEIRLPSLQKQRRIAEVLDRAEALRAKRRTAIAQLDTLTRAIFLDLFGDLITNPKGWPIARLPDVIYFQEGPGVRNWQFRNEGIKLINVKNIVEGNLVLENTERYLSPDEVEQRYKHFLLDAGDLVVASSGVTWGKIAEVFPEQLPLCLNTSMIRLRPLGAQIETRFIRAFVESPAFRKQILRLITGSAQPNFGPAHLKQVRLPLPPITLQREFAHRLASVEKLKAAHRASLGQLDTLFAALQHRAFRGEL